MARNTIQITTVCCLLAGALGSTLGAADATDKLRQDAAAILAVRDGLYGDLLTRIEAVNSQKQAEEISFEFPDGLAPSPKNAGDRRSISVRVNRAASSWSPGTASTPKYNKAVHVVDAAKLVLADGKLSGQLAIEIRADNWVPRDGKSRTLVLALTSTNKAGEALAGRFAASGDYGRYTGTFTGTRTATPLAAPAKLAALPADADMTAVIAAATLAYRQIRALLICHRYFPQSYDEVFASTNLPLPEWQDHSSPQLAAHLARLRALVEQADKQRVPATAIAWQSNHQAPADPWFGPVGEQALPDHESGWCALPADVGANGVQEWRFVSHWSRWAVAAVDKHRSLELPDLPDIIPVADAVYQPLLDTLGDAYEPPGAKASQARIRWHKQPAAFPQVPPPGQTYYPRTGTQHGGAKMDKGVHGLKRGRWYASTMVYAPRDVELPVAILAEDVGKLWVNDRLVWTSSHRIGPYAHARIRLRQGMNELLLACECWTTTSAIAMSFCVKGGPLAEADRAAVIARTRQATDTLPPIQVKGRHGDWSSYYPDATPPLAWNIKSGVNVKWRTPMPDYSAAPPVVIGDRVFINCEPHRLYCLDKKTGEILWQNDAHVFEFAPEDKRSEAMAEWQRGFKAGEDESVRKFDEPIAVLSREIKDGISDEKKLAAAEAKLEDLKDQRKSASRNLAKGYKYWCGQLNVREPGWSNNYGWTMGAPVTDGKHVWVKFATGVAACYTIDGKRLWMHHTRLSGGVANISSPLLLAGKFIVLGKFAAKSNLHKEKLGDWPPYMQHYLIAFDALSGDISWQQPAWATGGYGGGTGMTPLRLSNGTQSRDLILLGSGQVFDPKDGRLLSHLRGPGPSNWSGDPIVVGNRACFRRSNKASVIEYLLEDDGSIVMRHVLTTEAGAPGQAGVVAMNGRLYGNAPKGMGRHPVPWHWAAAVDLQTGKKVFQSWPSIRNGGLGYTPPAAAGNYAVICGSGPGPHAWGIGPKESAEIGFIRDGAEPYLMSTCKVHDEAMLAAPVFEGDCMFLRTYRSALCIQVTDEKGKDLVEQHIADCILRDIPARPQQREVTHLDFPKDWQPAEGSPIEEMLHNQAAPQQWLSSGPIPRGEDDPLQAAGGRAPKITPQTEFKTGDKTFTFSLVADQHLKRSKGYSLDMYDIKRWGSRCVVDTLGAVGRQTPCRTFYYAVLHNKRDRYVEVQIKKSPGQRFWLAGKQISDREMVHLPVGYFPVLVEVSMGKVPKVIKTIAMSIYFNDIKDPEVADRQWIAGIARLRPRLEAVLENLEPGAARLRIMKYLRLLDKK